jgi:Flp pilus assembly protein TadG
MVLSKHLHRLRKDQRGTVSIIMGLLIIPLVGALGIGFEVSNWYMTGRGMQNAADAAALAAATNGGANYDVEAKAVTAQYGFVDGTNNITVAASNTAPCPSGGNTCYGVTISGAVPLLVSQVVGYVGDTTLNGAAAKQLSSVAIAKPTIQPQDLCMVALATSGAAQGIRTNGAPTANLNGCNVMSNTAAQCNGSNLGAHLGLAHGTSSGCGDTPMSNIGVVTDPYHDRSVSIPPSPTADVPHTRRNRNTAMP